MQWEAFAVAAGWGLAVLVSVTAGQEMARARKRDHELWMLLGAFLGPFALVLLKLLGPAQPATAEETRRKDRLAVSVASLIAVGLALVMLVPLLRACFRL